MPTCFGVDIGNSGLRIALLDLAHRELGSMLRVNWCPADSQAIRRCSQEADRYLPDDNAWIKHIEQFIASTAPDRSLHSHRWLISSVRRDALVVLQNYLQQVNCHHFCHCIEVVDYTQIPLALDVDFPERVGIDRLLAALAATDLTASRPAIVVQAGSAVTVDLIQSWPDAPRRQAACPSPSLSPDSPSRDYAQQQSTPHTTQQHHLLGTFAGGAIVPGVPMMLRLLGKGADQLPEIDADDLLELPKLPGKNTEEAMTCGAAFALVGGVSLLIDRYRKQYGSAVPVILSGGDGMRLAPYIPQPLIVRPHLVHRGLLKLAELSSTVCLMDGSKRIIHPGIMHD